MKKIQKLSIVLLLSCILLSCLCAPTITYAASYEIGAYPPIDVSLLNNGQFAIFTYGDITSLFVTSGVYLTLSYPSMQLRAYSSTMSLCPIIRYELQDGVWTYKQLVTSLILSAQPIIGFSSAPIYERETGGTIEEDKLIYPSDEIPTLEPTPEPTPEPSPEPTPEPTLIPTDTPNDTDYAILEQIYSIDAWDNIKNLMQGFILYVLPIALSLKGIQIAIQLAIQFFSTIAKK